MSGMSRSAIALLGAATLAATTAGVATAAPHASARHEVSAAPAWVSHARAGAATSTPRVTAKIWLAPRDAAGLRAYVKGISTPGSPTAGQRLSTAQYTARFAPTAATVRAVQDWARSAGLRVDGLGADNHFVSVSGSAQSVSAAFTAGLRTFTVDGATGTAPTSAVTVPDSIAGSVLAVTGLDTVTHRATPSSEGGPTAASRAKAAAAPTDLGTPAGFVNAGPCSAWYGQKVDTTDPAFQGDKLPYAVCGYVPSQFRSVYGVTQSGRTGRGQTVAITDAFASPTIRKDADSYAVRHGDRAFTRGQLTQSNDTNYDPQKVEDCGGNGWFGEETLDVEAAHGMAPNANVAYYGAASCYDDDLLASLARVVHDDTASVVSNSWGEPTYVDVNGVRTPTIDQSLVDAYESVFLQGAAQGIGFYFSSGDDGDEVANAGYLSPDWPAADPWVTAVGGTALAIDKRGHRAFETGWGTEKYSLKDGAWNPVGYLYGAGGGCSDLFAKPFFQASTRTGCSMRAVPDVAMDADPTTGMLVGQTQDFAGSTVFGQGVQYGEYRIGGTSLAAPLFAGLQADAQQGRSRIGFANPLLYWLGARHGTFYDVTPQGDAGNIRVDFANGLNGDAGTLVSVRTFDQDSSLTTHRGWDDVTGVGTPTTQYLRMAGH